MSADSHAVGRRFERERVGTDYGAVLEQYEIVEGKTFEDLADFGCLTGLEPGQRRGPAFGGEAIEDPTMDACVCVRKGLLTFSEGELAFETFEGIEDGMHALTRS